MKHHLGWVRALLALLLLATAVCASAKPPTLLRMVDLRWISGQPELETWLGSLAGTLNRQDGDTVVFLVRDDTDAAWADTLTRMYGLRKEILTPGALFALVKPTLTGQVRYDPAQPWTRSIALTAAALAPGLVIAADHDLGLPTVLDLHDRWTDRRSAYAWAIDEYLAKADQQMMVLAPESGHLLADLIAARRLLAVDYAPTDAAEATAFKALLARLPHGCRVLGSPSERGGTHDTAFWALTGLLGANGNVLLPARNAANLSCFARFPLTRPLQQGRDEYTGQEGNGVLTLVYDGGNAVSDGSQSLDYALNRLFPLLNDPAMVNLPVGVEVPMALFELAPAAGQALLARQRLTAAELVAAPNGAGWLLPMMSAEAPAYLAQSAQRARQFDLAGQTVLDVGDTAAYDKLMTTLHDAGWQGALVRQLAAESLADQQPRSNRLLPGCPGVVAARVQSVSELRATLAAVPAGGFLVLFIDPSGLPPALLSGLLPELATSRTLATPSQLFRMLDEFTAVAPYLKAQADRGLRKPRRGAPVLKIAAPTTSLAKPTAADAIPVSVRIQGTAPVCVARVIYSAPDGRLGAADLRDAGNGTWTATLPPMLTGGAAGIRARVVDGTGFGISLSPPLTLEIPGVDGDADGVDDTLEAYQGSDPRSPDSDKDGLFDGCDSAPTHYDIAIANLFAPIQPPADRPFLVDAGASTTSAGVRTIPAHGAVTYRVPLKDLPAVRATLRVLTEGAGTITLNDSQPTTLETEKADTAITDRPLLKNGVTEALTVKLTAGDRPLHLRSLRLISSPTGPYILPPEIVPDYPPARVPLTVRVTVYDPQGIKAVRLRYGTSLTKLSSLELHSEGRLSNVYTGEIPAQYSNTLFLYHVEAANTAGQVAASPFSVMPVGRPRKQSVALLGSRELTGDWLPAPLWGTLGRVATTGDCVDAHDFRTRAGKYYVWVLAMPRERGLDIALAATEARTHRELPRLSQSIPAGSPDGWYKVGTFSGTEGERVTVALAPRGDAGFCGYGEVVLTQDEQFVPSLTHAGLDWFNSLIMTGVQDGDTVGKTITVNVLPSGNLDFVNVAAEQIEGAIGLSKPVTFTQQSDGRYTLDARQLPPGKYKISASGYRIVTGADKPQEPIALVTVSVTVNVPAW